MEIRNAQYVNLENTIINVEVKHPEFGFIPFTFNLDNKDVTVIGKAIRAWLIQGNTILEYDGITKEEQLVLSNTENAKLLKDSLLNEDIEVYDVKWQVNIQAMKEIIDDEYLGGVWWILSDNTERYTSTEELQFVVNQINERKQFVIRQYNKWRQGDKLEPFVVN